MAPDMDGQLELINDRLLRRRKKASVVLTITAIILWNFGITQGNCELQCSRIKYVA